MTTTDDAAEEAPARGGDSRGLGGLLLVLVVVAIGLTAFNLRPAVTSVGPLLAEIRATLRMSGAMAGLLTAFPPLCFVAFGSLAPRLVRRLGAPAVLAAAAAVIAAGLLLRPYVGSGAAAFVALSAVALGAIGVANVVMPVVVKRFFPHRVGVMTGFYSMGLTIGASLAAATTVPLARALGGWQAGLAFWAVPAALAAVCWLPLLLRRGGRGAAGSAPAPATDHATGPRVARSRTAWALAIFFGLQSSSAYVVMGWLPQIFRDAGFSPETAGLLLAAVPAVGIPLAFLLPSLAGRMRSQGGLVVLLSALGVVAFVGIALAPAAAPWLWVVLLGASQSTFPLALAMIGFRSRTPLGVVRLSSFAQGIGYLLSAAAPIVVGALNEQTAGWTVPLAFMAALMLPQAITGWLAGRPRSIEDEV